METIYAMHRFLHKRMRVSPQRHTLAVLRTALRLHQQEMADIAGCARVTIQKIELLQLRLTEERAERISKRTGCNLAWLLDNNSSVTISNLRGEPYTKQDFDDAQAAQKYRGCDHHINLEKRVELEMSNAFRGLAETLVAACAAGRFPLWILHIERTLTSLRKKFIPERETYCDLVSRNRYDRKQARALLRKIERAPWSMLASDKLPKTERTNSASISGIQSAMSEAILRVQDNLALQQHKIRKNAKKQQHRSR